MALVGDSGSVAMPNSPRWMLILLLSAHGKNHRIHVGGEMGRDGMGWDGNESTNIMDSVPPLPYQPTHHPKCTHTLGHLVSRPPVPLACAIPRRPPCTSHPMPPTTPCGQTTLALPFHTYVVCMYQISYYTYLYLPTLSRLPFQPILFYLILRVHK